MGSKYTLEEADSLILAICSEDVGPTKFHREEFARYERDAKFLYKKKIKNTDKYLKWRLQRTLYPGWVFEDPWLTEALNFIFHVKYEDVPLYIGNDNLNCIVQWRLKIGK